MGKNSGIKWDTVSEGSQATLDVIGPNTQLILRDPKTKQEWVTTSQDYANFLIDNGIISSSGWSLTGNAGTDYLTNFVGTTDSAIFLVKSNNVAMLQLNGAGNQFNLTSSNDPDNTTEYYGENGATHIRTFTGGVATGDIYLNENVNIYNGKLVVKANGNVGIGTTSPASTLTVTGGDIEVTDIASGVIIASPDGTRYRITVANGGAISASAV